MTIVRAAFLFVVTLLSFAIGAALFHPDSPLPDEWHPFRPLNVAHPITPLTNWKLSNVRANPELCLAVVSAASNISPLEDKVETEDCEISNRVSFSKVGQTRISELETACQTTLALAMWERHSLQPRAEEILGTKVTGIRQLGSYSCRQIRTASGQGNRWSTHARALAIDVSGFDFADGRRLRLIDDWDGAGDGSAFLKAVRDDACDWFGLTLSPDFNALHADHYHLQVPGWGRCR